MPSEGPPKFDPKAFGEWLTRHQAIEGIRNDELADRARISRDLVDRLRHGRLRPAAIARGQKTHQVNINSLAALAWALGMDFSHVASKAGLQWDGDRWSNFGNVDRRKLAALLGASNPNDTNELDERLDAIPLPNESE